MTTTNPTSTLSLLQVANMRKQISSRYENLTFVKVPAPTDTYRNHRRGARRKTSRATRTIL